MSDQWEYYPCQMGEHTAFIFYDHGLSQTIEELSQAELIKVWLTFKETDDRGLPTSESFDELSAFEDELTSAVSSANAVYAGRVTVNGNRVFYCYGVSGEESLQAALQALADRYGFEVDFRLKFDPDKEGYWQELFPTADDWQVMKDMQVLDVLAKHGDDGTAERLVDHWAYFPDEAAATSFRDWLQQESYQLAADEPEDDENNNIEIDVEAVGDEVCEVEAKEADGEEANKVCVRFSHQGPVTLSEITHHTIKLRQQAEELQGDYDGWETVVCKAEAKQ